MTARLSGGPKYASQEQLCHELKKLSDAVAAESAENLNFRHANLSFDHKNDTTRLLLQVCEKLLNEKAVMEQANFAEHTCDYMYLCQHFRTSLTAGLSDQAYRERLVASRPGPERARKGGWLAALCGKREFPAQQAWWLCIQDELALSFSVLRGGTFVKSAEQDIMPGEIMYLRAGDVAPCDGRILVLDSNTSVAASHVTSRRASVTECSTQCSALLAVESNNIIPRTAFLMTGSALCMVVRSVANSFVNNNKLGYPGRGFWVDTTEPPDLPLRQCQRVFKALITKAHCACRSYAVLLKLQAADTVVVTLTRDMVLAGTVVNFVGTLKKLGKSVILVNCDGKRETVEAIANSTELPLVDVSDCADDGYDALTPRRGFGSGTVSTWCSEKDVRTLPTSPSSTFAGSPEEPFSASTRAAQAATQVMRQMTESGAIVLGLSEAGLHGLLGRNAQADRRIVYALSAFHYPRCFRTILNARGGGSRFETPRRRDSKASVDKHELLCPTPIDGTRTTTSLHAERFPLSSDDLPDGPPLKKKTTTGCESVASVRSSDPAANLAMPSQSMEVRHDVSIDVLVSMNSIGIVSSVADCVLLKADLALLGTALELVQRM